MQLKPAFRVITVIIVSFCMVAVVALAVTITTAYGIDQPMVSKASKEKLSIVPQSRNLTQVGITETTSTTPTTSLTETIVLTATTSPTSVIEITPTSTITNVTSTEQAIAESETPTPKPTASEIIAESSPTPEEEYHGIMTTVLRFARENPLVPLGILFASLVTAIILLLITAQRQARNKSIVPQNEGGTAPLLPKVTPAMEKAYLQLKEQPDIAFPLTIDDIRIGRSPDNTIVITPEMSGSETVSRYHARLYRAEKWILEDLGSTNGIYINGQRTGRNYLRPGWEIGIGRVIFTFHLEKVEG